MYLSVLPVFSPDPFQPRLPIPQRFLRQGVQNAHSDTGYPSGQAMKLSRYNEQGSFCLVPFTNPYPRPHKNKLSEKFLFPALQGAKKASGSASFWQNHWPVCFLRLSGHTTGTGFPFPIHRLYGS